VCDILATLNIIHNFVMMDRRKFIGSTSLLAGAVVLPNCATRAEGGALTNSLIKPKRLKKGDTVGVITPGSALIGDAEQRTMSNLKSFGFKVIKSTNFNKRTGFIAGSDEERVDDIHEMFTNPDIDAIVCARGGYGTARILSMLDYDLIKSNPKVFIGFSDITALLYAIYERTGLVCYHGPVGSSKFTEFTTSSLKNVLMDNTTKELRRPKEWEGKSAESYQYKTWNDGKASGGLIGGNLSIVCSLLGTPYDVTFEGKILFLEEVGESLYRVDRMLTQLLNSGKLDQCSGIVLGVFSSCEAKSGGVDDDDYVTLSKVLNDRLESLSIPIMYGMPIGHIDDNATIPVGVQAQMDTSLGTLTWLEDAIR